MASCSETHWKIALKETTITAKLNSCQYLTSSTNSNFNATSLVIKTHAKIYNKNFGKTKLMTCQSLRKHNGFSNSVTHVHKYRNMKVHKVHLPQSIPNLGETIPMLTQFYPQEQLAKLANIFPKIPTIQNLCLHDIVQYMWYMYVYMYMYMYMYMYKCTTRHVHACIC